MGFFDNFNPVKAITQAISKPAELVGGVVSHIPVIGKPLAKADAGITGLVTGGINAIPKTFHNVDSLMHGRDPISGEKYTNLGAVIRGQFKFANHMDHMYESLGLKSGRMKKAEQAQKSLQEEQDSRTANYNAAIGDNTLDDKTREEITSLYNAGADSAKIASVLSNARAGNGVYGVRQVTQAEAAYLHNTPGRRQLLGNTSGYGLL